MDQAPDIDTHGAQPARRSHAERTELSVHRMLDAATQLILEVGTTETTLKDIGEKAGYSRGLANAKFGSKDALFEALANRCREKWITELQSAANEKSGIEILLSRLDAMISFAQNHPDDAKVMYVLWFESIGTPTQISEGLARFHDRAREDIKTLALEAEFFKGDDAQDQAQRFAIRFCGMIFGICYQWLVNEDAVNIRETLLDIRSQVSSGQLRL